MATKISGLSSATNIGASDLIQVVDVNDTTMAVTGTNKKATAQIVGNNLPVVATGSTTSRKLKDRFADTVNVKDFGAAGDGIQDDTAAIQAAINSAVNGGEVYLSTGTYKITAPLNFSASGVTFRGANQFSTTLRQDTNAVKIINNTGAFNQFSDFAMVYLAAIPTSGAVAYYSSGANSIISRVIVRSSHIGFSFTTGSAQMADNFQILDYENIGINCVNVNDVFISKFILNAGNTTRGALGGIRLTGFVEAFVCTDGDILLGNYSMTTDGTYTLGQRPAYNTFTSVYFDSSVLGCSIDKMIETEFVGCWFSGGRSGAGHAGISLNQTDSIKFTNTRFFNCGSHGCSVGLNSKRTTFVNCSANSNSVTTGVGVSAGISVVSGATDFSIIGGVLTNGLYTGTQGYGIFISADCDNFVIRDVNVSGNAIVGISDSSLATSNKTIAGNIGYRTSNTGTGTILSGTTSVVVNHGLNVIPRLQDVLLTRQSTNAGSTDLYISGITSTQFTINTAAAPSVNSTITWQAPCAGA